MSGDLDLIICSHWRWTLLVVNDCLGTLNAAVRVQGILSQSFRKRYYISMNKSNLYAYM